MEWYIIIIILGYLGIVFLFNLKILFYYEHPDDSKYNQGLAAKVCALFGLEAVWLLLCVLPTDAYNAQHNGGLDMDLFWYLASIGSLLLLVFPLPFSVSYYEADTDPRISKRPAWVRALKFSLIILVCVIAVVGLFFAVMRHLESQNCDDADSITNPCYPHLKTAPFYFFPIVIFTFFGWFPLLMFLGMGFTALPLGLIVGFLDRPKPISQDDYSTAKVRIGEQIVALKAVGEDLRAREAKVKALAKGWQKWKVQRAFKSDFNKFRQSVHLLENEFEALNVSLKLRGENLLVSYAKLVLGILSAILSILWVVDILLIVLLAPFLGARLEFRLLDDLMMLITRADFFLLDLMFYIVLVGYLMACVMVGCFRFNMRMFCWFSIHPMKKENTHLNSILFNIAIILLTCPGVLQLAFISFRKYCSGSTAQFIYDGILRRTPVLSFFFKYDIFVWLLMIFAIISFVIFIAKPKDTQAAGLHVLWNLKNRKKAGGDDHDKPKKSQDANDDQSGLTETVQGFDKGIDKTVGRVQNTFNVIGKMAI